MDKDEVDLGLSILKLKSDEFEYESEPIVYQNVLITNR